MSQHNIMEKSLAIYPIPNGDELNVFASNPMHEIRIMSMSGETIVHLETMANQRHTINITALPSATYIVEVSFGNNKISRSVFVKV